MPIFDYKCPKCENTEERFVHTYNAVQTCLDCNQVMNKLFSVGFVPQVFPSEGIHLKHVGPNGRTFRSKKEMQGYAKAHDLELGALL